MEKVEFFVKISYDHNPQLRHPEITLYSNGGMETVRVETMPLSFLVPQPSPDEAQVEEWIRETVGLLCMDDAEDESFAMELLRERLPAILGRGK